MAEIITEKDSGSYTDNNNKDTRKQRDPRIVNSKINSEYNCSQAFKYQPKGEEKNYPGYKQSVIPCKVPAKDTIDQSDYGDSHNNKYYCKWKC